MKFVKQFLKRQRGVVSAGGVILIAIAMLIAGVAAYFIPVMVSGFDAARMGRCPITDTDVGVTTAGGITVGNVTLDNTLIDTSVGWITSVTSNLTTDAPVADNISGQVLYLTGLTASSSHTITTTYYYNCIGNFTLASTIIILGPGIIILGFVVAVGVVGFLGVKSVMKG